VTLVPFVALTVTTLTAGWMSIRDNFYPLAIGPNASKHLQGWVDTLATAAMMICVVIIIGAAIRKWTKAIGPQPGTAEAAAA
jgi:carbon starvation protein CstA